jgi:pSer/pThr/pTyr-binding forkhead associated (FHA) protein
VQPFGKLTVVVNGSPETEYTLAKGTVTLGRAADNDIVLADRLASRHHARVVCAPDGCEFVDLSSSNGSWIGGQRVARRALREGDVIAVGGTELRFNPWSEAIAEETLFDATRATLMTLADTATPRLVVCQRGQAQDFPLQSDRLSVGRDPQNDLCLDDPAASRRHAEVRREGPDYVLADLGSTNGTLVNGQPIGERRLRDGDVIRIGEAEIAFRAGSAAPAARPEEVEEPPTHAGQPRRAVVFVPGMGGSELHWGRKTIWPNPVGLAMNMSVMQLPAEEVKARRIVREIVVLPGLFKLERYGRCINFLTKTLGYRKDVDLLEFPYDWRVDLRVAARQLAERVQAWRAKRLGSRAKIVIVAHSVGGLVSRYWIERLGGKDQVERLIQMGTPNYGLVRSFLTLAGGSGAPLGLMKEKARSISLSFPALYQVLSTYPAVFDGRGRAIDVFQQDDWVPPDCLPYLENGRRFGQELPDSSSIPTLCVFGYGVKTPTKAVFQTASERWWEGELRVEFDDGDGDVPTQSAVLRGAEIHPVRQHHGSLYVDQDVRARLVRDLSLPSSVSG